MDRLPVRAPWLRALSVALGLLCAAGGIATFEVVIRLTGQVVTALLILPVIAAAWFGGLVAGTVTVAVQAVAAFMLSPPAFSLTTAPADAQRLTISVGVAVVTMLTVIGLRNVARRYRAVVMLASEGIWTIDANGRTTFVNPRMADLLGYTPAEMRGRRFSEFVQQETVPDAEAGFKRRQGGTPERGECELLRKDGSSLWAQWAGTPLTDGSRFTGALAVVTDISERRRDETTIRQQTVALARANREKEDFLAVLGHELRNVMGPLMTAVRLMELKSDAALHRERAVIIRQAEHLLRLVDDISDTSRFMRGKLHIEREAVDMAVLVQEACESVAPLVSRAQHVVNVNVPDGLVVQGDTVRLRQVVLNLLTNAVKYTPAGGRISVTAANDDDSHVVIRVRDTGAGIAPDFLPTV